MESHGSKSPCYVTKATRPALPSPSSVNNYPHTNSPNPTLMSTLNEFSSHNTTPTSLKWKSPASKSSIPRAGSDSPSTNYTLFRTPSPSTTQIRPWLLADCVKSPVNDCSPPSRGLKLKSPKIEFGDCIDKAQAEDKKILLGRQMYKRVGAPLNSSNAPAFTKCLKLFNSPSDAPIVSKSKLIEVVDISDDSDVEVPVEHCKQKIATGPVETASREEEVQRFVTMMEDATHSMFRDMENLVSAIGQMLEATIGICTHATRGA